jgi:hypothetical protein
MTDTPPRPRRRPDHVVTPPARSGQQTNGAFQGAPNGRARTVVEHSVYNWVELVYQAFGLTVPSDNKKVALLGVRESTFADGAGLTAEQMTEREKAAGRSVGETPTTTATQDLAAATRNEDRFTRDARGNAQTAKDNSTVRFNDLLYMVWTNEGQALDQHVEVFRCTIDPGFNEDSTTGTPLLLEGYPYKAKPTSHKGESGALQIYSGAAPNIRVAREATKTKNTFTNIQDATLGGHAMNGNADWLFCTDEANNSIHIHWSLDYGDAGQVKNWSTGCTVLAHARTSDRFATDWRARWEAAPNKEEIPYLVVSSKYIVLYDDWSAALRANPGTRPTPASVIKLEGMPVMPAPRPADAIPGGYAVPAPGLTPPPGRVPSIATVPFVEAVQRVIGQLEAGTYPNAPRAPAQAVLAARLKTSLENLSIQTLTTATSLVPPSRAQ